MSLLLNKKLNNHTQIGIWRISESLEDLISSSSGIPTINPAKELQRASVRSIAKIIFQNTDTEIKYDVHGKPHFKNSQVQISISHTTRYSALIGSSKYPMGIDIELISPRIENIFSKFMSDDEIASLSSEDRLEQLYVYWCAKEALYKYYGEKGLIFKEQLLIDPFKYNENGDITGHIITESFVKTLPLHYEKFSDHMLVYVAE